MEHVHIRFINMMTLKGDQLRIECVNLSLNPHRIFMTEKTRGSSVVDECLQRMGIFYLMWVSKLLSRLLQSILLLLLLLPQTLSLCQCTKGTGGRESAGVGKTWPDN